MAKYRELPPPTPAAAGGETTVPEPTDWEDLDEEVRLLLRAVAGDLDKRTHQKMDRDELQVRGFRGNVLG